MNNIALDVAIGLTFIYLLYSLLATTVKELIATMFSYRSKMLERGIEQMLDGENVKYFWWDRLANWIRNTKKPPAKTKLAKKKGFFASKVTSHPIYKRAAENAPTDKPSYLNASTFSDILVDLFQVTKETPILLCDIKQEIDKKQQSGEITADLQSILNLYIRQANGDLQRFKLLLENWYDDMMDRVAGWYKRQANRILLIIGLILAIVFNVSTLEIVGKLSKDQTARNALVQNASDYVKNNFTKNASGSNAKHTPSRPADDATPVGNTSNTHPRHPVSANLKKAADSIQKKDSLATAKGLASIPAKQPLTPAESPDSNSISMAEARMKLRQIDSLYDKEITKDNKVLGLGWGDFGYTEDTLEWSKNGKTVEAPKQKTPLGKLGYVASQTLTTPSKWLGFLITALAISLGAPFWFDLLNKFINMRVSGKKPDDNKKGTITSKTVMMNQKPDPTAKG